MLPTIPDSSFLDLESTAAHIIPELMGEEGFVHEAGEIHAFWQRKCSQH
jgi:hypothetical protein